MDINIYFHAILFVCICRQQKRSSDIRSQITSTELHVWRMCAMCMGCDEWTENINTNWYVDLLTAQGFQPFVVWFIVESAALVVIYNVKCAFIAGITEIHDLHTMDARIFYFLPFIQEKKHLCTIIIKEYKSRRLYATIKMVLLRLFSHFWVILGAFLGVSVKQIYTNCIFVAIYTSDTNIRTLTRKSTEGAKYNKTQLNCIDDGIGMICIRIKLTCKLIPSKRIGIASGWREK